MAGYSGTPLWKNLGSARASRAGDGALAIANFSRPRTLRRGAAMSTRGRVRSPERRHRRRWSHRDTGKMPAGPTGETPVLRRRARRSSLLHYLAQGGDAFSVLLHRADSNADPFRQVVTFHRAHDDFALEKRAKNREAIADIHENEICRAGNEPQIHRSKFFFEIGAPLVGQLFRFALMLFIGQRS